MWRYDTFHHTKLQTLLNSHQMGKTKLYNKLSKKSNKVKTHVFIVNSLFHMADGIRVEHYPISGNFWRLWLIGELHKDCLILMVKQSNVEYP